MMQKHKLSEVRSKSIISGRYTPKYFYWNY